MKNPVFLRYLGIVLVIITVIGGGFFLFQQRNSVSQTNQEQKQEVPIEKVPSQTTKTYTDEAGFSFDYPDDLIVAKKDASSSATYASIAITAKSIPGSITFVTEDTSIKTPDEWITKNLSASPSATKEIALGSLSAKEIVTNDGVLIIAIDQGIIFRLAVSSQEESKYWQSVYNTILSSFSFVAPQSTSSSSSSSTAGEDVILEEEVIE